MGRVYERLGTRITAQASAAITAGADSAGAQTLVDKASAANADGAQWFDVYVDVTVAPSSLATCKLYTTGSSNGIDESAYEGGLSVPIPAVTDQYRMGQLYGTAQEFKAKIAAEGYGFTATLYITPAYLADA